MTDPSISPVQLERAAEQIRQERETFDLRKSQEERWFSLRIRMGYVSMFSIPTILVISAYILFNAEKFPGLVVNLASGALLVDGLGLFFAIWKMILNPAAVTKLQPVTTQSAITIPQ